MIPPILSGSVISANGADKNSPQKIADSAKQFESLMLAQMLKTMHEEDGEGWLGTGEDQTSSSAMGMADEYFAQALSSRGGLGLAQMISNSLAKRAASTPAENQTQADQSLPGATGPAPL